MIERGYGRMVNISSGYGAIGRMGGVGPALNALTRIVAGEAHGNVKVNSVDSG